MNQWPMDNPQMEGEALKVEMMAEVCKPLAKGRMELD